MFKSLHFIVYLSILACPLWVRADQSNVPDERLVETFQKWLDEECERHPVFATQQGKREFDGMLDDVSPEARAADLVHDQKTLEELNSTFVAPSLSRPFQIDLEIWKHFLKYRIWQATNTDDFANDPRIYLLYCSDSVFSLFTQSTLPRHRNIENAISRIGSVPKIIDAAKRSIKNPPAVLTEVAIKRTDGAITFYEKDIYELANESPQLSSLRAPCLKAIEALQEFRRFLKEDVLPRSTGEWRIGKERFNAKLQLELDAGWDAQQIIDAAEMEADRVEQEMYYVAKQLWHECFPMRSLPPDDTAGRRMVVRSVLQFLGTNHGSSATLVNDAKETVAKIKDFIAKKDILALPTPDQCEIIEMPEFQRGFSAAYLSPAPPLDAKAKSLYAISPPPSDWPSERQEAFLQEYNHDMLQILTIHEAYPGHYIQLDYGNRNSSLIRKVLYSGVFAEGWAVYTEQMMLDEGYGGGSLALRLHQLKFYIRAVLNAILDHHMHCSNMTDEDALRLLMERGYQTEGEAVGKVQRAKQSSCQLSTYFTGRMAFYRLRQSVQRARGDSFVLGRYHEEVLSHGTLPVKYLPELVQ